MQCKYLWWNKMKNRDLFLNLIRIGVAGVSSSILISFDIKMSLSIFISMVLAFITTFIIGHCIRNTKFKDESLVLNKEEHRTQSGLLSLSIAVAFIILSVLGIVSFFNEQYFVVLFSVLAVFYFTIIVKFYYSSRKIK